MEINRGDVLQISGAMAAASLIKPDQASHATEAPSPLENPNGCLVDTTLCVGCRKCEQACTSGSSLPQPKESFEEMMVLENERRMDETSYTVVNKYYPRVDGAVRW